MGPSPSLSGPWGPTFRGILRAYLGPVGLPEWERIGEALAGAECSNTQRCLEPGPFLIGLDRASRDRNMGLALGEMYQGWVVVREVLLSVSSVLPILARWIQTHDPAVLAFDAPLGWPAPMGQQPAGHRAGEAIPAPAAEFFSRHNDCTVRKITGKRPVEVGANLIGRTAHATVNLLRELREQTKRRLPLATGKGKQEEYTWHFTFLGAKQDAFREAGGLGIRAASAAQYFMDKVVAAYGSTSKKIARMRQQPQRGEPALDEFTDEEREKMI